MKRWVRALTAYSLLGAMLLSGCGDAVQSDNGYTVRVLLPEGEGYEFLGSQIVTNGEESRTFSDSRILDVAPGDTVRFAVKTEEGIILESESENVKFSDGFITVENVRVPTTLDITARVGERYVYFYNLNNKNGKVISNVETGTVLLEKTEITLRAEAEEDSEFLGFSTGNFLSRGGKLLCEDEEYTFNISEDTVLFANFESDKVWTLTYHANGGKGNSVTDTVKDSFYYCPNTRPDKGYFTRDGYVLTGYNTKPDGSGDSYGLGWNVIMPEDGEIELYCMWEKAADTSDFTYETGGGNVFITGYDGDAEFLVIPQKIDGLPVKVIREGAFTEASFKEVYIPRTVTTIASKAFDSCASLEKIYLSDSVMNIYDNSFNNCTSLKTVAPQATQYPHADSLINYTHSVNFERLITRENNILLMVSGSTNIYGLTASKLEAALDNKWDVVTYATVASTPNTLYAEIGFNYLDSNDILMFTPEASPDGHQWGTNYWKNIVWQLFEGAYDAISLVDISNYTKVFSSFATYNQARRRSKEKSYEVFLPDFNEYGEHITYRRTGNITDPWIKWDIEKFFTEENQNNFNRVLDSAKDRGIPTLIGWLACTTEHTLLASAKERDNQLHYMNLAKELYHGYFFGDLANHIYDPDYVYDSAMHLNTAGGVLRTERVIEDIQTVLDELGLFTKVTED